MIEYRVPTNDELRTVADTLCAALLHGPPDDEGWERARRAWEDCDNESAWDGGGCVGSAGAYRFDMVVPGGALLPTAAVTHVGVLPTHRRRGIARELMTRVIEGAASRGKVLAALRASEATIYRRFGFGVASEDECFELDPALARPIAGGDDPTDTSRTGFETSSGTMRLLARDEIVETIGELYREVALRRSGAVTRPDWSIERYVDDAVRGNKPNHVAVHRNADGVDDGFVHYSVKWSESTAFMAEDGHGSVLDLWGSTLEVERELWRYLCSIDLIIKWTADGRPVDDVIRFAAHDPRAVRTLFRADEQWLRLVDADAALTARRYAPLRDPLAIAVSDPMLKANNGTWVITDGTARRDDAAAPALRVDVADISAVYLGGTSWADLDAGARVTDGSGATPAADVLAQADAAFAVRPLPYSGTGF